MYQLYTKCSVQVYQCYQKNKDRDFVYIIPLVMVALYKILEHVFWRMSSTGPGIPKCQDSQWYINYAQALAANITDGLDINDVLYFGYNILLSLLLTVFKDPVAVVYIQAVVAGLSVILVYKIAVMLFNQTTAIIASIFYINVWGITLWSLYILSDSFFLSLLLLCVYLLLMALESDKKLYKVLFAVTALYMVFFRPTGVVAMAIMLLYIAIRIGGKTIMTFLTKHRLAIGGGVATIIAVFAYLYAGHKLDLFINSLQYNAKLVLYNVYAKGWIYDKSTVFDYYYRPDYRINIGDSLVMSFIVNNWEHVSILYLKRAAAFLGTWVWQTDPRTFAGALSFVGNFVPTALFLTGTIAAMANGLFKKASIVWLLVLAVFAFCILLFIDSMYRYRLPAMPFIAIVAAYGTERIARAALVNGKKLWGRWYEKGQDADCNSRI